MPLDGAASGGNIFFMISLDTLNFNKIRVYTTITDPEEMIGLITFCLSGHTSGSALSEQHLFLQCLEKLVWFQDEIYDLSLSHQTFSAVD